MSGPHPPESALSVIARVQARGGPSAEGLADLAEVLACLTKAADCRLPPAEGRRSGG